MSQRKRTEIAELGEFGLIDCLTKNATSANKTRFPSWPSICRKQAAPWLDGPERRRSAGRSA